MIGAGRVGPVIAAALAGAGHALTGITAGSDPERVEAVVAHEYFHNWSGNRVTCRDWFQLSLKEGLTVFRDQEFSMDLCADASARAVKRIEDVRVLRTAQFPEDAGPMAHPVRPDSYIEISNFYTVTIYEKGAEVVRMMQTLVGRAGFERGITLYFERHDGQAVTCDDFAQAIADANPDTELARLLPQFKRWYAQAGTPRLAAHARHGEAYSLGAAWARLHRLPVPDDPVRPLGEGGTSHTQPALFDVLVPQRDRRADVTGSTTFLPRVTVRLQQVRDCADGEVGRLDAGQLLPGDRHRHRSAGQRSRAGVHGATLAAGWGGALTRRGGVEGCGWGGWGGCPRRASPSLPRAPILVHALVPP